MKKLFLAASLVAFPAMAQEPPAQLGPPQQTVALPFNEIQGFAEKLGNLPYKDAAPLLAELQRLVAKYQTPITPPSKDKK